MAKKNSGKYAVGIDLGTTYSCVAVWREEQRRAEIIPNEQGNRITPSCVAFKNGTWLVGEPAVNQAVRNPTNTFYDAKRLIGRRYSDPDVKKDTKMWPFKVIGDDKNDQPFIVVTSDKNDLKYYSPIDISAKILTKMCEYAETYLNSPVKDVVITVPAYFNDSQRQATIEAGNKAGLNVLRIINEPSAAALAYGVEKSGKCNGGRNIFIFDLGGGTFDVSLVNVKDGVYEVKAKAGDNHLGGEDFVNNMMNHFIQEFKRKNNKVDISGDPKSMRKLRTECEKAKKILSTDHEVNIEIDSLYRGIDFSSEITRQDFEKLNMGFFQKCMKIVKSCLEDAKMDKSRVHDVVLVGGSSRIPKLQQMLRDFFNGKELDKSINPDEAVAYGAAVQAAMLSESTTKGPVPVLFDVTPLSLGCALIGDIMSVLIPRNTPFPIIKKGDYCTIKDNQEYVQIDIYEGERARASHNNFLGSFNLTDLPLAPRGLPLTVCFEINDDGILHVTAEEETAGKITVKIDRTRLSNKEITDSITDGKKHAEEDEKFLENANAVNDLNQQVYYMEEVLRKMNLNNSQFSSKETNDLRSVIDKANRLLGDSEKSQKTELVKSCLKEAENIYNPIKSKIG